jgi:transcriptional regulator with XRE-family HTH domain
MTETPRPSRDILVGGARAAREHLGLRQEDAAKRLRELGLASWLRGTVAQVEVGARRLTLQEFFALAIMYETTPAALIGGEDEDLVALTTTTAICAGDLRSLLSGQVITADRLRPGTSIGSTRAAVGRAVAGGSTGSDIGEAERYVARRLGVTVEHVNDAALARWGRSLSEERDRRVAEPAEGASPRQLQALRGHVTRELLADLTRDLTLKRSPTPGRAQPVTKEGR